MAGGYVHSKESSIMRGDFRLLTLGMAGLLCAGRVHLAHAAEFHLTIGNPIAATAPAPSRPGAPINKKLTNSAVFVVRVDGCSEPAKARLEGTAEGMVGTVRRSEPLILNAMPTAGVYAVNRTWPAEGAWVANLVGTCQNLKAGAVVPIAAAVSPTGFLRETTKFFPRAATPAEVDAALKAHAASAPAK